MIASKHIKQIAKTIGFDACGIAEVKLMSAEMEVYKHWLKDGNSAEMHYLHNHLDIKEDIRLLQENAQSVIITLSNYYPHQVQVPSAPQIAKYAYGRDYHKVLLKMHKQLLSQLEDKYQCEGRIFVDTAPVLERQWAVQAGLGWIGKSNNLISPQLGVHTLISGIALDMEVDFYDHAIPSQCGTCSKCLDACPSGALLSPYHLDASKCISYLTIEHRGDLPNNTTLNNSIFGCDKCLDACPYSKKEEHKIDDFIPKKERLNLSKDDWKEMDEERFNILFNGTPVKRPKYSGIKRNLKNLGI